MYQVIARKYRPQAFAELISQEHIKTTLENAITQNRIAHGYAGVDVTRLWGEIPAGLATLDAYAAAVAGFVAR